MIKSWRNKTIGAKSLCLSEIVTIIITFHQDESQNFQHFYWNYVDCQIVCPRWQITVRIGSKIIKPLPSKGFEVKPFEDINLSSGQITWQSTLGLICWWLCWVVYLVKFTQTIPFSQLLPRCKRPVIWQWRCKVYLLLTSSVVKDAPCNDSVLNHWLSVLLNISQLCYEILQDEIASANRHIPVQRFVIRLYLNRIINGLTRRY